MRAGNKCCSIVIETMENRVMFDASLLTETIVSSTLPATISDHAVLHGTVVVNIANNSGVDEKEKVVTGVEIANGALVPLSGQFGILKNKTLLLVLKSGQSKNFTFPITIAKGKLADGVDTIYSLTVNQQDAYSQSAAGGTLTVHAPIITLSETETFVKLVDDVTAGAKAAKPTDKVAITNTGTDPSTDAIVVAVYATPDDVAADGTSLAKLPAKKIAINPGKTVIINVPLAGLPGLTNGTYKIITQVTQLNGTITTTDPATAPVVTVAAPGGGTTGPVFADSILTLTPKYEPDPLQGYLQTISQLGMEMSITNSGSSSSGDGLQLALFASTSSTFDSSAVQVGAITLPVASIPANGGKRTFNALFNVSSNFPGTADANGNTDDFIFVQVTDAAGTVTLASYPTAVNFAGPIVG